MSAPIGSMRDLLMDIFAIVLDDENTSEQWQQKGDTDQRRAATSPPQSSFAESAAAPARSAENDDDELVDVRWLVHQSQIGCVIGKGGSRIRELRDQKELRNLKVYTEACPESNERVVQLVGPVKTVADLLFVILHIMDAMPPRGPMMRYDPSLADPSRAEYYGGWTGHETRPRASEWGDFGMGPSTASDALASSSKVAATNANALSSNLLSASSAGAVPTGAVSAANSMSMSGGEQMAMSFGYGLPPIADGHAAEQYRAAMPMPFQSVGGPQPPFMPQYGPPPGYMPPSGWKPPFPMPPPFMPPPGNPGEAPLGMPPMPFMPYMSQPMPHQLPLPGIPDAGFKPPAFPYQNSLPPRPNTPLNGEKLSELVRVPESLVFAIEGPESRRKLQVELDSGAEIRIRAPSTPPSAQSNGFMPLPERVIEVFGTARQNHVAKYLMQLCLKKQLVTK